MIAGSKKASFFKVPSGAKIKMIDVPDKDQQFFVSPTTKIHEAPNVSVSYVIDGETREMNFHVCTHENCIGYKGRGRISFSEMLKEATSKLNAIYCFEIDRITSITVKHL